LTSQAQVDANRRNSIKSTGPKDTSMASSNALKHGLTATRFVVLPDESLSEYEDLMRQMYEDYNPQTAIEEILIEKIVSAYWRLRRIKISENAKIEEKLVYSSLDYARKEARRRARARKGGYGDFVSQYVPLLESDPSVIDEKDLWLKENGPITDDDNDSLKLLKKTNEERKRLYTRKLLHPQPDILSMRYESSLEHQFFRALIMLIKIKEIRNGFVSQKTTNEPKIDG